jgi:FixJ family two-component response regulator
VVASGYKRRMLDEMGVGALDDCLFLEKPYRTQEMADILAEAMTKEP